MSFVRDVVGLLTDRGCEASSLSAGDYVRIAEWEKMSVPLDVIRQAITDLTAEQSLDFDAFAGRVQHHFEVWLRNPEARFKPRTT